MDYIKNVKILKIKPIDLTNKNKCIAYWRKLAFRMLSFSSYIDLDRNEYCYLYCRRTKSKKWLML